MEEKNKKDIKRYYWLKLNENFFEDDTIIWLEEQENGIEYVNFYLKLALKSLQDDGRLIRYVGETLIPYDVKALSKLTNTKIDTVAVAMKTFEEIGLTEILDTGEIYLKQINEMIGTETQYAIQKRRQRAIESREKLLGGQCPDNVLKCPVEIEKEIEIRDKSIEKDTTLILGEFENVKLSNIELEKLNENYGETKTNEMIEKVSAYVKQTGKRYKSHYATILTWIRKDNEKQPQKKMAKRGSLGDISNLYD